MHYLQRLLVLRVRQHVEQQADELLGELVLDGPEDELLQEGVMSEAGGEGGAVLELRGGVRVGQGVEGLGVLLGRAPHEVGVLAVVVHLGQTLILVGVNLHERMQGGGGAEGT